ncbi:hypothetical protein CFP71_40720 [Amycolatopsis thailandensis]|uniref:ABC transporter permease n=1 Tax=Amycolatopsis thailandensis TaxID=589330 RepID=A0A229RC90_9PSEU|nr:ABC transporter permease [Amycolatopsis thailandensis]OXM44280.1 hypothetical protein CFP71_40720 [Amycolatopsis thailandensis]
MTRLRIPPAGRTRLVAVGAACVIGGFAVVAGILALTGGDLAVTLSGWGYGAAGTPYAISQTVAYAAPLILIALGATPALRAGVIVVGAEGQVIAGAIASTAVAFSPLGNLPMALALPVGALAGVLGGAAWAMIPAIPLLRWRVSEILTALMANYLAVHLLTYLLRTVMRDPEGHSTPRSAELPAPSQIPLLPTAGRLTAGVIVVGLLVLVGVWWHRTRSARALDVFAESRWLAGRLELTPARAILGTGAVSGAAAGLAGWMQVAGVDGNLTPGVAGGIGFTGLVVAVIGASRPVPIVAAGLIMASLTTGASGIQLYSPSTPSSIGQVTQGVLLLAIALALAVAQRHRARRRAADG